MPAARTSQRTFWRRRAIAIGCVVAVGWAAWSFASGGTSTPAPAREASKMTAGSEAEPAASAPGPRARDPYASMRASGPAKRVLRAARRQMGVQYVYGASPRDPDGLAAIGNSVHEAGFDCSSFVAYAFQAGIGEWVSGSVAHTDQIWTQGGAMPLSSTAGETDRVVRGMATTPPPGGYRSGDLLLTRSGAGGYWGHVVLVSERGLVIQSYPPDVYETAHLKYYLAKPAGEVGWVRVKSLAA